MDSQQLDAFKKVIPKYIPVMENQERVKRNLIQKIKNEIKKELNFPSVSIYKKDMAKFVLIHQIEQGVIKNKEDFQNFLSPL